MQANFQFWFFPPKSLNKNLRGKSKKWERVYSLHIPIGVFNHNLSSAETNGKTRSCYGSSLTTRVVSYCALLSVGLSGSPWPKPPNFYQTGVSAVAFICSSCPFPSLRAILLYLFWSVFCVSCCHYKYSLKIFCAEKLGHMTITFFFVTDNLQHWQDISFTVPIFQLC